MLLKPTTKDSDHIWLAKNLVQVEIWSLCKRNEDHFHIRQKPGQKIFRLEISFHLEYIHSICIDWKTWKQQKHILIKLYRQWLLNINILIIIQNCQMLANSKKNSNYWTWPQMNAKLNAEQGEKYAVKLCNNNKQK